MDSFTPKSSFIEKAEYDDAQRQMTVTFKTGTQTKYFYVFPATWLSFKQSPDHSSYYSKAIKGHLMSVPVVRKTIGRRKNEPLKQAIKHKARTLDHGNIFPHTHTGSRSSRKRSPGNIPNTFR